MMQENFKKRPSHGRRLQRLLQPRPVMPRSERNDQWLPGDPILSLGSVLEVVYHLYRRGAPLPFNHTMPRWILCSDASLSIELLFAFLDQPWIGRLLRYYVSMTLSTLSLLSTSYVKPRKTANAIMLNSTI